MKKTFRLTNLDCANCASKMENNASKVEGINSVNFNFMMQKVTIDAPDEKFNEILDKVDAICQRVDSDCKIIR